MKHQTPRRGHQNSRGAPRPGAIRSGGQPGKQGGGGTCREDGTEGCNGSLRERLRGVAPRSAAQRTRARPTFNHTLDDESMIRSSKGAPQSPPWFRSTNREPWQLLESLPPCPARPPVRAWALPQSLAFTRQPMPPLRRSSGWRGFRTPRASSARAPGACPAVRHCPAASR